MLGERRRRHLTTLFSSTWLIRKTPRITKARAKCCFARLMFLGGRNPTNSNTAKGTRLGLYRRPGTMFHFSERCFDQKQEEEQEQANPMEWEFVEKLQRSLGVCDLFSCFAGIDLDIFYFASNQTKIKYQMVVEENANTTERKNKKHIRISTQQTEEEWGEEEVMREGKASENDKWKRTENVCGKQTDTNQTRSSVATYWNGYQYLNILLLFPHYRCMKLIMNVY